MKTLFLSRLTLRIFYSTSNLDFLLALALPLAPILLSYALGIHHDKVLSDGVYRGYWGRYNFTSFVILLPLGLFLGRWGVRRIVPVSQPSPENVFPALVSLVSENGKAATYQALRNAILSPWLSGTALSINVVFHLLEAGSFFFFLFETLTGKDIQLGILPFIKPGWQDWSLMFLHGDMNLLSVSAALLMIFLVYASQFAIIQVGILFFLIMFRHNWFFLQRIYQRRSQARGQVRDTAIVIDLDDPEKCFGFRRANEAFNAQLWLLAALGSIMLISRFMKVPPLPVEQMLALGIRHSFPDVGQALLAIGWLLALAVVCLPVLVKLLPMIPFLRGPAISLDRATGYFLEFLPGDLCPVGPDLTADETDYFTSRFAENGFWPTGNNRARWLFRASFFVLLILLLPAVQPDASPLFFALLATYLIGPWILTRALLNSLESILVTVDERLVIRRPNPIPKPQSLREAERDNRDKVSDFEIELQGLGGNSYRVRINSIAFGGNTVQQISGRAKLDAAELLDNTSSEEYGKALGTALFDDEKIRRAWDSAQAIAKAVGAKLRLRLLIDAEATALHSIRWETMSLNGEPLFQGDDCWFSRYIASYDAKASVARPKSRLKALVIIANPTELAIGIGEMQPVPVEAEVARATAFFKDIIANGPDFLASGGKPSLPAIIDHLQGGYDIVYLVCHGALIDDNPTLLLEKSSGQADFVSAKDLVQAIQNLGAPPSLIVLASCQSAGTGDTENALTALGPLLAAAGVPAVVAMQGKISMSTVAEFMPRFFAELKEDGRIDRAMAISRGEVARSHRDHWMPVLFMRLKNGRLWEDYR